MNDLANRQHQMLGRVRDFGTAHATDFPAASIGGQLFASVASIVAELDGHAATQASRVGAAREGTATRGEAREALGQDLEAINRTARAMADDTPGIGEKFRLPRLTNDQALLNSARAFATDAAPLSTQFIAHELSADFLAELNSDILALEAAISRQSSGVGGHVSARAAIDNTSEKGIAARNKLDAIVKNKYANDPATLAEWTSASHTERAARHKTAVAGPSSPQASDAPGDSPPSGK